MAKFVLIPALLLMIFQLQINGYTEGVVDVKKVVMIIAPDNFRDEELLQPKKILEDAEIIVKVASVKKTEAKGMLGARIMPDLTLQDINILDFDAVVFIGGSGASIYLDNPLVHKIARDAYSADKLVTAICIAPAILAEANLLKGKKATVWSSKEEMLKAAGATYTGKSVERDGNIITASGPTAAGDFGKKILEALTETQSDTTR